MISEFLSKLVIGFSDYSDLVSLSLLLLVRVKIRASRYILFYLMVNAILHALTIFLAVQGKNNMWVYHLIGLSELILVFAYYRRILQFGATLNSLFISVVVLYFIDSLFLTSLGVINHIGRSTELLFIVILCLYFFYKLYDSESLKNPLLSIDFWITSGLLIYSSGGFFGFLLSYESLFNEQNSWDFRYGTWIILALVQTAKAVIISYGALHVYLTAKPKPIGSNNLLV